MFDLPKPPILGNAVLKNALDYLYGEWGAASRRPASPMVGRWEHVASSNCGLVLLELRMVPLPDALHIPNIMNKLLDLSQRQGPKPEATRPTQGERIPHAQKSQNAPLDLQEALFDRVRALDGVCVAESLVSVPEARAFHLGEEAAVGPAQAFQKGREFAHIHPPYDGSLHVTLPPQARRAVLEQGWGEPHPASGKKVEWHNVNRFFFRDGYAIACTRADRGDKPEIDEDERAVTQAQLRRHVTVLLSEESAA